MHDYDKFLIIHEELEEERSNIYARIRKLEENYLKKHGNEGKDYSEGIEILSGLKETHEWKKLTEDLKSTNQSQINLYKQYLSENSNIKLKKDKIIALWTKFKFISNDRNVAKAVNCRLDYAKNFHRHSNGEIIMTNNRKRLSEKTRTDVLDRDNYSCVACGAKQKLQIHHIIPLRGCSEIVDIDKLATLCKNCHYLAHNGNYLGWDLAYKGGVESFWKWTKNYEKTKMWFVLKDIKGIGTVIYENIYNEFKSVDNLKKANLEDLMKVKSVNLKLAKKIKIKIPN